MLPSSSALQMEVACSSKTSVSTCKSPQRHNPQAQHGNSHRHENLDLTWYCYKVCVCVSLPVQSHAYSCLTLPSERWVHLHSAGQSSLRASAGHSRAQGDACSGQHALRHWVAAAVVCPEASPSGPPVLRPPPDWSGSWTGTTWLSLLFLRLLLLSLLHYLLQ